MITVVVADDHSLFRTGVVQSLALDIAIQVIGEASSGKEAIDLVNTHAPDIVLLDISMPGNGIETAREIIKLPRAPRVVMLTVSEQDDDIICAIEAGAVGYIVKGVTAPDLIAAVKRVAAGESFVSPNLALRLVSSMKARSEVKEPVNLSKIEERTLRFVAMGMSNREIGDKLGILEKAVKYRMTRIMKKLNVRNRVEASLIARQRWGGPEGVSGGSGDDNEQQ